MTYASTTGAMIEDSVPTARAGAQDATFSIHSAQKSVVAPRTWPSRLPVRVVWAVIAATANAPMIATLTASPAWGVAPPADVAVASVTAPTAPAATVAVEAGVQISRGAATVRTYARPRPAASGRNPDRPAAFHPAAGEASVLVFVLAPRLVPDGAHPHARGGAGALAALTDAHDHS
jgi:hypothetical protein